MNALELSSLFIIVGVFVSCVVFAWAFTGQPAKENLSTNDNRKLRDIEYQREQEKIEKEEKLVPEQHTKSENHVSFVDYALERIGIVFLSILGCSFLILFACFLFGSIDKALEPILLIGGFLLAGLFLWDLPVAYKNPDMRNTLSIKE